MEIIFYDRWTLKDAESNPQRMFIFGDNWTKHGTGGQACLRYSKANNTFGIPTKIAPGMGPHDFFNDKDYQHNIITIQDAFDMLPFDDFEEIALPTNCWGTGLSDMPNKCPKTFEYVKALYDKLSRGSITSFSRCDPNDYPEGWDYERVKKLADKYDSEVRNV